MEILAENRTTINKKLFTEGMLCISRDGYGKSARKAVLIFLGMWLLFFIWTLASGGSYLQTLGSLCLVALLGLWVCVYLPRDNAGRYWKAQEAKYGAVMDRTTAFYPEELTITGECVEQTIPYTQITEIKFSRNLMVLICENKTGILLSRRGFYGRNEEEIKALIQGAKNKE